uniref:Peptidase S1 domain-containing protein n=1 Tax=Oryctolagus cuniculus TaxID=9986 RepID=A0A5F9DAV8_RABIT|nr:serine protease 40 [Oryctolagus cuniculus]
MTGTVWPRHSHSHPNVSPIKHQTRVLGDGWRPRPSAWELRAETATCRTGYTCLSAAGDLPLLQGPWNNHRPTEAVSQRPAVDREHAPLTDRSLGGGKQKRTGGMGATRREGSVLGRQGACALAALLLWLRLPPLRAQVTPSNRNNENLADVCGKSKVTGKIFGGKKAEPERWPWQASLLMNGRHICGAALISSTWVVSAAHCFQRSHHPADYRILLGYNQLSNPGSFSRQMTVNKVIVHADFNKFHRFGSDITLLQLDIPVEFNSHIRPACLPDNSTVLPMDSSCWISGWGMLTEDVFLPAPFQLQEAKVSLIDSDSCRRFFIPPPGTPPHDVFSVKDDMICAGDTWDEKSICRGDSGGPLVCFLRRAWYLVGVTSWSWDCRSPVSPSVFTRITYFANWIQEQQRATPTPDPSKAPPEEKPPVLVNVPIPEAGTVPKPRVFLVLLTSATLLLLILLQSR